MLFVFLAGCWRMSGSVLVTFWDDCNLWRCWSRWPWAVLMVWGKCFLTRLEVNPGNVVKKPRSIAFRRVECFGVPKVVWWKIVRSDYVVFLRIIPFVWWWCVGCLVWHGACGAVGMLTVQSFVTGSRGPSSTVWLFLFFIVTLVYWKIASQPLLQSCPMERRLPDFKLVKTLALFALAGACRMLSCVMLVE